MALRAAALVQRAMPPEQRYNVQQALGDPALSRGGLLSHHPQSKWPAILNRGFRNGLPDYRSPTVAVPILPAWGRYFLGSSLRIALLSSLAHQRQKLLGLVASKDPCPHHVTNHARNDLDGESHTSHVEPRGPKRLTSSKHR